MNLKKFASFTDIHFGKKQNSEQHNKDCIRFLQWFCDNVRNDPKVDHIVFMGDWHENRSALNISTLHYSYIGASMLNDLGLPVYFIVGNHDLFHRNNRDIHSVILFNEMHNFIVIDEPTYVDDIHGGVLLSPYLFHHEYSNLTEYLKVPIWMGHFEFKGFNITGHSDYKMPVGPDPEDYKQPHLIFSGHFHKRQADQNIVYTGNTFPMDFGDAGDIDRGMTLYDFEQDDVEFRNWHDCPKYIKTTLSKIADGTEQLSNYARVRCIVDTPITFEQMTELRQHFVDTYQLREFIMEEANEVGEALSETEASIDIDEGTELADVNDLVMQMLDDIDTEHIDNQKLIGIYQRLTQRQ